MLRQEEAVSKIALAENHHYPVPEGCADFQRLPPFRGGYEGGENHLKNILRHPPFVDFQMFSDSRHRWPARQELPARQISADLSRKKTELFRRNKVRRQENMSVSGSGLCEACLASDRARYIFSCPPAGGLVLFGLSRTRSVGIQDKKDN